MCAQVKLKYFFLWASKIHMICSSCMCDNQSLEYYGNKLQLRTYRRACCLWTSHITNWNHNNHYIGFFSLVNFILNYVKCIYWILASPIPHHLHLQQNDLQDSYFYMLRSTKNCLHDKVPTHSSKHWNPVAHPKFSCLLPSEAQLQHISNNLTKEKKNHQCILNKANFHTFELTLQVEKNLNSS